MTGDQKNKARQLKPYMLCAWCIDTEKVDIKKQWSYISAAVANNELNFKKEL